MNALTRTALGALVILELWVGIANQWFPEWFYSEVPTVDLTPPFSEHYARDFGGATLGLAVVLIAAWLRPRPFLVLTSGIAFSAFALPHLWFHLGHLDGATPMEATVLVVMNILIAGLGLLVIVLGGLAARRTPPDLSESQRAIAR